MLSSLKKDNKGICSICSSHKYVVKTALKEAKKSDRVVLIESTSNQVNQFGGYTGMTPEHFVRYVYDIAESVGFDKNKILLGGDHLGPNPWRDETIEIAMNKAKSLVKSYVAAGYTKIHLDTSMRCKDDKGEVGTLFNPKIVAERAAQLCQIAEENSNPNHLPHYIIGTDVPIPGGAIESLFDLRITPIEEVEEIISLTKESFYRRNLIEAFERIIAVVVQPGVEFSDNNIIEYDRKNAAELSNYIRSNPKLVYEAHSTDYQSKHSLKQMVEDQFSILKVGPWLTYAFREAVFALSLIEKELLGEKKGIEISNLHEITEKQMLINSQYWNGHYKGSLSDQRIARKYSYSDRIRYYWPNKIVNESFSRLIENLTHVNVPLNLLSQYLPFQYKAIREGNLKSIITDIIEFNIKNVLDIYAFACGEYTNHSEYREKL